MASKQLKFKAGDKVRVIAYDSGGILDSPNFTKVYTVLDQTGNDEESVFIDFKKNFEHGEFIQCLHLEHVNTPEDKRLTTSVSTFPETTPDTGAKKYDAGKAPLSLLARAWLEGVARVLGFGSQKYGRYNWLKGHAYSRLTDAALRHINAFNDGEDKDAESGESHLLHASACLMFLYVMSTTRPDLDDRFKGESK